MWLVVVVQLLNRVWLSAIPWTEARQASLSFTISQSFLKLTANRVGDAISLTISSSFVPFSSCLQSYPASGSFPVSQLFTAGGQSTGASASVSVLPVNIQGWFALGLTGLFSLLSKGLWRVSNTIVGKPQFFSAQMRLAFVIETRFAHRTMCFPLYYAVI